MAMSGEHLSVEPMELQFPFDLNRQISCTMQLTNKTDDHVAFKVKTTNPKKYCVRPNTGFVFPRSSCNVVVTMQAQKEAPPNLQCKDKFLLQTVVASSGSGPITPEMFHKESGNHVEECKLRVTYVSPSSSPAHVQQVSDESALPDSSVLNDGSLDSSETTFASRGDAVLQDDSAKEKAVIVKLVQERDSFIQQNTKLRQELELLRRESKRSQGGVASMYVVIIALVAILLGYLIKKT